MENNQQLIKEISKELIRIKSGEYISEEKFFKDLTLKFLKSKFKR